MIKSELINKVAVNTNRSSANIEEVVDSILTILTKELSQGGNLVIRGFGRLEVVQRKARVAHDISRGMIINVPAQKTVTFTPYFSLKRLVNLEKE